MLEEGQKTTVEVGSLLLTLFGLTQVARIVQQTDFSLLGHLASHKSYSVKQHWATNDSKTYNLFLMSLLY